MDYITDTNRVGGITQARKIAALAEAHAIPVIPHAGQMHNYPSDGEPEFSDGRIFSDRGREVGNELFWYLFTGEPKATDIDLADDVPGFGLTIDEAKLQD